MGNDMLCLDARRKQAEGSNGEALAEIHDESKPNSLGSAEPEDGWYLESTNAVEQYVKVFRTKVLRRSMQSV
jgi:hypothetical protein